MLRIERHPEPSTPLEREILRQDLPEDVYEKLLTVEMECAEVQTSTIIERRTPSNGYEYVIRATIVPERSMRAIDGLITITSENGSLRSKTVLLPKPSYDEAKKEAA